MIEFYTDGSCFPNKIGINNKGGFAFCVVREGVLIDQYSEFTTNTSNNRMELSAIIKALEFILNKNIQQEVIIYSDSQLCVNTFNEWMHDWVKRDWKNGKVKNLDLVKKLYFLFFKVKNVKLKWIKGHSTSKWNNYVDMLCNVEEK